jgi:hypothetical protein
VQQQWRERREVEVRRNRGNSSREDRRGVGSSSGVGVGGMLH